jgi:hypothetical protein
MSLRWGHEDPERRGAIPERENPKLDFLIQSLKGIDGGLLLCDLKVVQMLGYLLLGVKRDTFVVDEGGHIVLCCVRVHNDEGDKVDHVHAHDSYANVLAGLAVGVWTVGSAVEGGPGDISRLSCIPFLKLLLAVLDREPG